MKRRYFGLVLLFAFCAAAAEKPLDVRDLVTANQFHQMGLDKLSPEELAAFNAWLATYGQSQAAPGVPVPAAIPVPATKTAPAAATRADASFGQETLPQEERGEPKLIETRILGTFTGWNGRTTFTLENGQVWVQAAAGDFETHLENPKVVIKRLAFGYLLTIPGQGATVFVRRTH